MLRITDLALPLDHAPDALEAAVALRLGVPPAALTRVTLVKRGNDARNKRAIKLVYAVDVMVTGEAEVLAAHAHDPHIRPAPDTAYQPPVMAPEG